jgi:hypothetical protein
MQFRVKIRLNHFVVTVWREWLTDEVMKRIGLGERQIKAIMHLKVTEIDVIWD